MMGRIAISLELGRCACDIVVLDTMMVSESYPSIAIAIGGWFVNK